MSGKLNECNHEGKTRLSLKSSPFQHEYCRACGWHKYKNKEYSKEEWYATFVKE